MSTVSFHRGYPPNNPHIVDKFKKVCKLLGFCPVENQIWGCGWSLERRWKEGRGGGGRLWMRCGKRGWGLAEGGTVGYNGPVTKTALYLGREQ